MVRDKTTSEEESRMEDPAWQEFANSQITIPLGKLLQLVPQFVDAVTATQTKQPLLSDLVQFTNPSGGLW